MKTFKIALIRKLFSYLNVQVIKTKFKNFLNLFHGQTQRLEMTKSENEKLKFKPLFLKQIII